MDDLKSYYDKYISPSVAKIMIVGDCSKENAVKLFNSLKGWKARDVKMPDVKITHAAKPGVYFIDVPRAKQSVFNVGHLGLAASDPGFYAATVMNHKLGGDFSSVLNMILRETKSFTYGAHSGFSGRSYPGSFKATVDVQTNATLETAQILRDEITKYRQGITAENLGFVKSALLKSMAGRFETLGQLSGMLTPIVMYGLPFDYVKQREALVKNLTQDGHTAIAQKYLHAEKLVFVVAGDKETQFDKLKELGLGDPILVDKDANPVGK
jgi:zinc protease